jgi:hypothetical protein
VGFEEQHLALAEKHIVEGEGHVLKQALLVETPPSQRA